MVSFSVCALRDKGFLFLMLLQATVATQGHDDTMHLQEPYSLLLSRLIQLIKLEVFPSMQP